MKRVLLISSIYFLFLSCIAQSDKILFNEFKFQGNVKLYLFKLEKKSGVSFNYKNSTIAGKTLDINLRNATISQLLDELKSQVSIQYKFEDNYNVILTPIKAKFIHGIVLDVESSERIPNAALIFKGHNKAFYSDENGYFRGYHLVDTLRLQIIHIDYLTLQQNFKVINNQLLLIKLKKVPKLKQIDVSPSYLNSSISLKPFDEVIPIDNLIPTFGGETDALSNIKMLTGVQNVSFGEPGLIVRGGGPDQNMVLLDGIPVYNTFHLLGLYSIFNSSSINDIKVYKDAFPAKYTSRLSSVVDVTLKNGNKKKHELDADVGVISSGLSLNGPIVKDKLSYSVSARRTYADLLMLPVQSILNRRDIQRNKTSLWYFDVFGKLHWQINKNNELKLTAYNGGDQFISTTELKLRDNLATTENTEGTLGWRNKLYGMQWRSVVSSKFNLSAQATLSSYNVEFKDEYSFNQINNFTSNKSSYSNGLSELKYNVDANYLAKKNNILSAGIGMVKYQFNPFERNYSSSNTLISSDTSILSNKIVNNTYFAYLEDKVYFDGGNATFGLRYSRFKTDSIIYNRFQPRILIIQNLENKKQLRFGFSSVDQFVHLVPNNNLGLPLDIWLPVTDKIKPLSVSQLSAKVLAKYHKWEWSSALFSKFYNNILEHKNGVNLLTNSDWESDLLRGSGRAFGFEVSAKALIKKWSLYGGYTYCRSKRTVESINNDAEYFSKYDRPHSINLLGVFGLNSNSKVTLSFTFASGNPVTLPSARYISIVSGKQVVVEEFDQINNFRLPATHHLDISYQSDKQYKKFSSNFIVGIYNVYNQLNPFMVYIGVDEFAEPTIKVRSYLPMMPMIKYRIKL